jgi:hypothetical protein
MRQDADHLSARRRAFLLAAAAGIAVLAAGCGGGSSAGSAGSGGPIGSFHPGAPAASRKSVLAYTRCMRSHGASALPDPASTGRFNPSGVSGGSPAEQAAVKACQHLLPKGAISSARQRITGAPPSIKE